MARKNLQKNADRKAFYFLIIHLFSDGCWQTNQILLRGIKKCTQFHFYLHFCISGKQTSMHKWTCPEQQNQTPVWNKQKLCINLKNCQSQEYNFPKANDEDQILMKTSVLSESHSKYEIWFFPSIISSSGICLDPSFKVRDFSTREA